MTRAAAMDSLSVCERDEALTASSPPPEDPALAARVDALMSQRESLGLTAEQARLLERTHKAFVRQGAALPPEKPRS